MSTALLFPKVGFKRKPKVTLKFLKADARWKAWDRARGPEIMSCPVVTRA